MFASWARGAAVTLATAFQWCTLSLSGFGFLSDPAALPFCQYARMRLGPASRSAQGLYLVLNSYKCTQCCVSLPALYQEGTGAGVTSLADQLGVPDVADVTVPWSRIPVLSVVFSFFPFFLGGSAFHYTYVQQSTSMECLSWPQADIGQAGG